MVELADTVGLRSTAARLGGSSPSTATKIMSEDSNNIDAFGSKVPSFPLVTPVSKENVKDPIFLKEDEIFYAQIKTMEGTLTGSQAPRSKKELSLHKNSYFVAAFETGTGWTFNSKVVPRIKGQEFWSLLGLDYNFILETVKKMIKEIEDYYYNLISTKN